MPSAAPLLSQPPATLTVAAAQYPIDRHATVGALMAKLERWVADAAAGGAKLVVFPEYGAMEIAGTCEDRLASDLQLSLAAVADRLPEMDAGLAGLARRYDMHILAPSGPARVEVQASGARGADTEARPRYVNSARLIAPSGAIGIQDKIIMTPFERGWGISAGAPLRVFDTALGRIGVLICYDCEFPLLARAQVEAGARLILAPSCTERVSGWSRVRAGAMARALEGTIAVVTSPTVGEALWSPAVDRNAGAAGVFVPAEAGLSDTGVLAEGRLNEPGLVFANIDFERLARLKSEGGEMHNVADWRHQPGAATLPRVEMVAVG